MGILDAPLLAMLDGVSAAEEAGGGRLQQIGSLAPGDWHEWTESIGVVTDYRRLYADGEPPPDDEWKQALYKAGDARRMVANNAAVVLRDQVAAALANLRSQQADLASLQRAMADVNQAIGAAASASQLVSLVDAIGDAAQLVLNPNVFGLLDWARTNWTYDAIVDAGVAMLGNYYVLVTLAAHGFGSLDELERRVKGAFGYLHEAAEYVRGQQGLQEICEYLYDWQAFQP